jgi:hypothetical protein
VIYRREELDEVVVTLKNVDYPKFLGPNDKKVLQWTASAIATLSKRRLRFIG